jgi:hypothetical protein
MAVTRAAKAYSTINTVLEFGAGAGASSEQLAHIKTYPDLGGAPEQIATTDLEDDVSTNVNGVQNLQALEFTCNYTPEEYEHAVETSNTEGTYTLKFGNSGANGIFKWTGQHTVRVSGGNVNGVREMVITVAASSKITKETV